MDLQLKTEAMTATDLDAQVLRAIMFAVFEEYLLDCSAEDFALRYGSRGSQALAKYVK